MGAKSFEKKAGDKEIHTIISKEVDLSTEFESDAEKHERKSHKKKNKNKLAKAYSDSYIIEQNHRATAVESPEENQEEDFNEGNNAEIDHKKKKKKKHKTCEVDDSVVTVRSVSHGEPIGYGAESLYESINSKGELTKKEKKRKKNGNVDSKSQFSKNMTKIPVNDNHVGIGKANNFGKTENNEENGNAEVNRETENENQKGRKKRKRGNDGGNEVINSGSSINEVGDEKHSSILENKEQEFSVKDRKKKKKKKSNSNVQLEVASQEITKDSRAAGENVGHKKIGGDTKNLDGGDKVKKKKGTMAKKGSEGSNTKIAPEIGKGIESTNPLENSAPKKKSRRVSFSENVEIFPEEGSLVWGKRFSKKEDEMVKEAVRNYIRNHNLGDEKEGSEKVMHCSKYPELRNCWKEIGAALPWRPVQAVYYRAHILFQRDEKRAWTQEELELVRDFHKKHGSDWKTLAEALNKHRFHVKDAWRRVKLSNVKKGHWSQDEYQNLFDLVNKDLRMRALAERKIKHGMLRDNICWTAISEKLETRNDALCCLKWYRQLTSPMVAEGEWLDTDDYHLLIALYELDACCMEDVDWDCLLEHRSGDVCRKRWNQMVKHLGEHGNKSFADQVDVLLSRYCPDVLEAREIYDSKTPIDE